MTELRTSTPYEWALVRRGYFRRLAHQQVIAEYAGAVSAHPHYVKGTPQPKRPIKAER